MEVTDHKYYYWWYWKKNRESPTSGLLFKKQVLLKVSYFARSEMETVNSELCYIKDLIFLENIVWSWNSLDVQSTDSPVELSILSYSRFFC